MGKSSKPTIGFKYYMTLQAGLCYGPVDALIELRAGDRTAWAGTQSASGDININAPNLFGGDKKEGGLKGTLSVHMGEATQAPDARLVALRGSPQPAYRGLMTVVYDGEVSALNPYVKQWRFKVRGLTAGWRTPVWESALCGIDLTECMAINPAHFIYRLWVEQLGWDPSTQIDLTRHQAAAQTLYDEGMGICIKWSRSDGINRIIAKICDHIGGVIAEDPATGKQFLRLIRDDYDPATLPVLDASNIMELMDYQQPSVAGSVNQVTVTFTYATTGKEGSVTAHNLANQQAQGVVVGKTVDYSLFPTHDLAARAAERDCNSLSSLLSTGKVRIQRPATPVLRGDVMAFTFAFGRWTVSGMPVRVLEVDEGLPTDTTVVLKFAQDQFGVPATSYVATNPGGWTEPVLDPQPITEQLALEASYRDLATRLSNADLAALDADSGYLTTLAVRPQSVAYNYTLMTELSGASVYAEVGAGDFAPSGTLHAAMPQEAGPTDVTLDNASGLDQVEVGGEAIIDDGGGVFEVCRVDAIDPAAATATLARGCVDTPPIEHAAGARVYFTDHYTASDPTEYVTGETVNAKLLTRTGLGELDMSLATAISATMDKRQLRPYAPGALTVNGVAYPANITGAMSIGGAPRNRLTQADQLIDTTIGAITPETGTTYNVRVYLDGTLAKSSSGHTSLPVLVSALSAPGTVRVELEAQVGALVSLAPITATFNYINTDLIGTESGDPIITEAGENIELES